MSELTTIWTDAILTGAELPPPFSLANSPNARSIQINNQSDYWLIIYKTSSNVPINRLEPFSFVVFPYEADISVMIDESAGKVTGVSAQFQFVDYATFDYVMNYQRGSTFFAGTGTTTITNGSSVNVSSMPSVNVSGMPSVNVSTMPSVNVGGGSVNVPSATIVNEQLQVAQIYSVKASYTVPTTTTTTNPYQFNLQFLNNGTLANVHHVDVYITSSQGKQYNVSGSAAFAMMADGSSWNASSTYQTTFNGTNSASLDGPAVICNLIQLQIKLAAGTLTTADTITVYYAIDSNETAIGTTDGVLVKPYSTNIVDISGSITTGNQAQQVLAASSANSRRYLFFQNLSTSDMYINFGSGSMPTIGGAGSIWVPANGGSFVMEGMFCSSDYLFVICATAGAKYTCKFY